MLGWQARYLPHNAAATPRWRPPLRPDREPRILGQVQWAGPAVSESGREVAHRLEASVDRQRYERGQQMLLLG
jgi:hypothetical protein